LHKFNKAREHSKAMTYMTHLGLSILQLLCQATLDEAGSVQLVRTNQNGIKDSNISHTHTHTHIHTHTHTQLHKIDRDWEKNSP